MDLLPLPRDPTFATPDTPYLSAEDWDLGPFRTYLSRNYRDLGLTEDLQLPTGAPVSLYRLQRVFTTIPTDKLRPFAQTWLFFGLLAEFLGLNELEDGTRLISLEQAREEMAVLYRECSKESENGKLLTGVSVLTKTEIFVERMRLGGELAPRFNYLYWCLNRCMVIVANSFAQLGYSLHFAIAGLGELFMTSLYMRTHLVTPRIILPPASFNWFHNYMAVDGDVEKQMLAAGWCPSQIEKMRSFFQGVSSLHYVTRLRPQTKPSDHVGCTRHACQAFQIDISTYKPRHISPSCQCKDVSVDEMELTAILRTSGSYPILKTDTGAENAGPVRITLETYEPGMNYVALSHVWADGLGNPHRTALPSCQLLKIATSVAQLNEALNKSDDPRSEYRVWIDTICCPVALAGKAMALERIADVYRNSAHVLVFDSSVMCLNSTTCDIAEMLLRTFSCSAWMRRLWTLQEAMLPESICVQFEDRAITAPQLMQDLYLAGTTDARLLRIWHDITSEFNYLRSLESVSSSLKDVFMNPELLILQRAIHFRTVSVPSDEPLCIAVLMSLKIDGLVLITDGEERMARVWAALAERLGGIATALVFFLDETLSIKGWRWAPKSLLGGVGKDYPLDMDSRSLRFGVGIPVIPTSIGKPTPRGLRIQAQGGYLTIAPIRQGLDLQPWHGVTKRAVEPHVLVYRESAKTWYRLADWHRSYKLRNWSDDERQAYDEEHPYPLLKCIRSNSAALIFKDFDLDAEVMTAILGQAQECLDDDDEQSATLFERERAVMFIPMGENDVALLNKLVPIANRLADDQVTADLVACGETPGPELDECHAAVKKWLQTVVAQETKEDPEFARLMKSYMGDNTEEFYWSMVLLDHSSVITMRDSKEDHIWFVD